MAEHIARYDEFARYLARRGFVVCGEDHVGHGRTAAAADDLGHIPLEGGKDILLADVDGMRRLVDGRYDGCSTPYVLFGHSMGSFIARAYLPRHRPWVDAAILCGTGHPSKATSRLGNALAHLIARFKGERHRSKLLDRMGVGAYGKRIEGARTPLDWLCTDPAVVDAYRADPLCGAMFTVGGYAALTDLTEEVVDFMHAAPGYQVPVLFVSGWDDPVGGDWGKSMLTAAELLRAIGMRDVRTIRYKGMRHEVLERAGARLRVRGHRRLGGGAAGRALSRARGAAPLGRGVPRRMAGRREDAGRGARRVQRARYRRRPLRAGRASRADRGGRLMTARYVIALDQGTTSSRAVLVDAQGRAVDAVQNPFPQIYPQPGWVEHAPSDILSSQLGALAELTVTHGLGPGDIAAIGITNQRETTVVWNRETGRPVGNAIVWQCRRTAPLIEAITRDAGAARAIADKTGLVPDAYFSASKIKWLLDNVPGAREDARAGSLAFGTVDSWLDVARSRAATVHATDPTNASRTLLYDIHRDALGPDELFDLFDIPAVDGCPRCAPPRAASA